MVEQTALWAAGIREHCLLFSPDVNFHHIASEYSPKPFNFGDVVGQLQDNCRVGFQLLHYLAGRNQSFDDSFSHHPAMQRLCDNRGCDVRFHFAARHAVEEIPAIRRQSAQIINDNVGINQRGLARWQGINIHTIPRLQRAR
jgi:hypothetical protein